MIDLSTNELIETLDGDHGVVISAGQIKTYAEKGLIVQPVKISCAGNRRGVRNYYPESTVSRIRQIKKMTARGYVLDYIKKVLGPVKL